MHSSASYIFGLEQFFVFSLKECCEAISLRTQPLSPLCDLARYRTEIEEMKNENDDSVESVKAISACKYLTMEWAELEKFLESFPAEMCFEKFMTQWIVLLMR